MLDEGRSIMSEIFYVRLSDSYYVRWHDLQNMSKDYWFWSRKESDSQSNQRLSSITSKCGSAKKEPENSKTTAIVWHSKGAHVENNGKWIQHLRD